jgi:hypothetical protein
MCAAVLLIAWSNFAHAGDAARPAIDVSLVTPDDFAAIVIHPRRIARSPLAAELLKDETIAGAVKNFGIDPGEVEEIVVLFRKDPDWKDRLPVTIIRFTHDAKEVLTRMREASPGPKKPEPIREIQVGGKTYLELGTNEGTVYVPRRDTIVIALSDRVGPDVAIAEPKGPLVERLKKAAADNDVIVACEIGDLPLDKIIEGAKAGTPPLNLDAAKTLQGGTAIFNLTGPSMMRMVLDAKDAEAAGKVQELLEQGLKIAAGSLASAKQTMPKEAQTAYGPLVKLAEQFVDSGKTVQSGSQVMLDIKRPEMLDTARPSIIAAVRQSVIETVAAGRRAKQMVNMKQIGLAMISYDVAYEHFPLAASEKNAKPLLSWRVAVLPFLDEQALYEKFHLDEPWDSPHNLEAAKKMPDVFQSADSPKDGKTRVMVFTGKGAAFDGGKTIGIADIRDGLANTIMLVEAGADKAVPWTKPEDLPFDPQKPSAALGKVSPEGFVATFFDGHVQRLKVDDQTLKALITPNGGEVIDSAKLRGGQ